MMTVIDLLIIGVVGYALVVFTRTKKRLTTPRARYGFGGIIVGLSLVALFYLADLLALYVLPFFMPMSESMAVMQDLHLNQHWLIALFGVTSIALGFAAASRETFALIEHLEKSRTELQDELWLRRESELARRESEERFRAVVDNSPTKIHIKDADGRYTLINREAEKLYGVTDEEARGKTTQEIFPEKQVSAFVAHDKAVLETGEIIAQEEEWLRDGQTHTYLTVKFPILDSGGKIRGVGAIGTDITERTRTRAELERLKQQNDLILRSAGEGIYGLDTEGRTTFVNPTAAKMIGWDAEELIGMRQHDVLHHTKADGSPYPREECPIYAAFKDGSVQHVTDEVFWRKDGSSFPVEYVSAPIRESGELIGAVVVFRDISDRMRAQEAVLAAKEQAEQANRAKSEFLANMSHELRTPLNAIIGFSEVIKDETFGPVGSTRYRDYASDINESGHHLLGLISDILDLSKIESGTSEIAEERIDIAEVTDSALMMVKGYAETNGIGITRNIADDVLPLRADKRKLMQILVNLLSNAVKFTDRGGTVILKAWCRVDSGHVFQIIDNGIGIALADMQKALSPFQQIDSALNRKYEGTGLGLPLTKALVESHGGSLDLQSEVGVGTTVTIRFPAERVAHSQSSTRTMDTAGETVG